MSKRGNCYHNTCMESFHNLIKRECIYLNQFRTRKEARQTIFEYIECFYNRKKELLILAMYHHVNLNLHTTLIREK
ncbi:IS3 family transposase [Anoxybacillus sp. ST70]|uniref:IS3 family transposase n=1 Tax=Anoxybacillus sp. ST70 TaxID=2864180 RepID=UPI0013007B18|nr:IS3 family transposase [Anoxybacillus sp. ST70]